MATVVLKVGGSLKNQSLDIVSRTIVALRQQGNEVVIVHGGGPAISAALAKAGLELPFIEGRRVTPPTAIPLIEQVLVHHVNSELVAGLTAIGLAAVAVHGGHGIIQAIPFSPNSRTGRVCGCVVEIIHKQLSQGYLPVVAPLGHDENSRLYNINADEAAGAIAGALLADKLIFFTDVPGVYWDFANKKQLYDTTLAELSAYRQEGVFSAGMIPKVEAMQFAAAVGVPKVYVIDGRDAQSALWAVHDVHADDQKNAKSQRAKREIYGTRLVTQLNSMKE